MERRRFANGSACRDHEWTTAQPAKRRFCVDRYCDAATGVMDKNTEGKMSVTVVTLHPEVTFSGEQLPSRAEIERMHHEAHEACFIANSVKSEVRCEPVYGDAR